MDVLKQFIVPFMGLKEGHHLFEHRIEKSFFDAFDNEDLFSAAVTVKVDLERKPTMMVLDITYSGDIAKACDRCNESCDIPVNGTQRVYYRFSEGEDTDDDDVYFVAKNETEIDLSHPLYEFILLSMPSRHVHEEGQCDPEIIALLEGEEEDDTPDTIDPRWDALKKLK